MKKLLYLCVAVLALTFASCEKDEVGGTATQALAGEWYVTVDAVDASGNTVLEDPFGLGKFLFNTYNTAANVSNQMWIDDNNNFWGFKVKATSDANNLSFTTGGEVTNANATANEDGSSYYCKVNVEGGKVLPGAGLTPHGTAADSIVFYVSFDDDAYPSIYGYAKYKVSGIRYTGLVQDD